MSNPMTRRAERWQAEAARLSRINSTTNQIPKEANLVDGHDELHSLGCRRDEDGELVCVCVPIIEVGDDAE